MDFRFKAKVKNYLIGIGLLMLAAMLFALVVMCFLFTNTRATEKFGTAIGWICFLISFGVLLRKTVLKNAKFDREKAFVRRAVTRARNRKALNRRYAAYLIRKYKREHRPFCETHFGEEVRRRVS